MLTTALLLLTSILAFSGPPPESAYWVYLSDHGTRGSVALSDAALARRAQAGIALDAGDRAIDARVLGAIERTGAEVRTGSRWLNAVSVNATAGEVRALRRLGVVERVERMRSLRVERDPAAAAAVQALLAHARTARTAARTGTSPVAAVEIDSAFWGPNYRALAQLNIPRAAELGLSGVNVRIAIFDTGFERQHEAFRNARLTGKIRAQYDFIGRDSIVANEPGDPGTFDQERQGTWVWSLVGGFIERLIVGPAYNALYYLAKVDLEPGDTHLDEDRWVQAAEWADSLGVDIILSSLTYRYDFTDGSLYTFAQMDGATTPTSIAAREAARRGILVVQSIGNTVPGDGTLAAPSDADGIIAVGAVDYEGNLLLSPASGRGPTVNAATKPELVAPAVDLVAANSANLVSVDRFNSGTTFATPLVAGGAALFMEAWPDFTAPAVREALLISASNHRAPNNFIGWGIPDVAAAILFPQGITASTVVQSDFNGVVNSVAPTFRWRALVLPRVDSIRYVVELARDTLFTQRISSDTVLDAFSLQLRHALPHETTFYWRVTATSPNGIRRTSDVGMSSSFTAFRIPEWVRQLNLNEPGAATDSARPTFRWQPIEAPAPVGPFTFDVEVLAHSSGEVVQRIRALRDTARSARPDNPLSPNQSFRWRVIARLPNGLADTVTSVQPFVVNSAEAPPATLLYQNFPNPFPRVDLGRFGTSIWFDLAEDADVQLSVHDLRGRMVRSLIPRKGCAPVRLPAGIYGRAGQALELGDCVQMTWDGRDESGDVVPGAVYVLRLTAGEHIEYRRMLFQPSK